MSIAVVGASKGRTDSLHLPGGCTDPADRPPGLSLSDFGIFVRDYTNRLIAVARRILPHDEDAADAVQDAFMAAMAARHTFQGRSTVYTWLYRIVINTCVMKLRARPRRTFTSLEALSIRPDFPDDPTSAVASRGDYAEHRLELLELRTLVRDCINQLPDDYRTILLLRDIRQLDTQQTADLLQLSCGAVKTRLHRARQALRTLLGPAVLR